MSSAIGSYQKVLVWKSEQWQEFTSFWGLLWSGVGTPIYGIYLIPGIEVSA